MFVLFFLAILWNTSLLVGIGNNVAHNASCCKQCGLLKTTHVQIIWPMQAMKVTKIGTKQIFSMLGIK